MLQVSLFRAEDTLFDSCGWNQSWLESSFMPPGISSQYYSPTLEINRVLATRNRNRFVHSLSLPPQMALIFFACI